MRSLFVLIAMVIGILGANPAQAYDIDTHFYETYMMARYAGISHEVAAELAVFAQWIDVSFWTSPMFPVPWAAERLRRLFHFPVDAVTYNSTTKKFSGHGQKLKLMNAPREDNPFSRELLKHGIEKRNLMIVGGGEHVREDSFGHAGYPYTFGHGLAGHSPDRPFQNVSRHDRMTAALFRDMVIIRSLLDESALDKTFVDTLGDTPHYQLSAEELQERYLKNSDVRYAVENNILADPRYTRRAIEMILKKASNHGMFTEHFSYSRIERIPGLFAPGNLTQDILRILLTRVLSMPAEERDKLINMDVVRKLLVNMPNEYFGVVPRNTLINEMVFELTNNLVPHEVNETEPTLYESDGELRAWEMRLRLDDWRAVIHKVTGKKIRFASETLYKRAMRWFGKKDPAQFGLDDHELVTPTVLQRLQWLWHVIPYESYFPKKTRKLQASIDTWLLMSPDLFQTHMLPRLAAKAGLASTGDYKLVDADQMDKLKARYQKIAARAAMHARAEDQADGEELAEIIFGEHALRIWDGAQACGELFSMGRKLPAIAKVSGEG